MAHADFVSATKSFSVVMAKGPINVRVPIFVPIVEVRRAVVAEVFTSAFDTIVEATAGGILKL